VVLRDGTELGTRELAVAHRNCEDVTRGLAIAVALAVEAVLLELGKEEEPHETKIETHEPKEPTDEPPPVRRRNPSPDKPSHPAIDLGASIDVASFGNVLPRPSWGAMQTFSVGWGRFEGQVGLLETASTPTTFGEGRLAASLLAARLTGCGRGSVSGFLL